MKLTEAFAALESSLLFQLFQISKAIFSKKIKKHKGEKHGAESSTVAGV
jgi:hypothetical protein